MVNEKKNKKTGWSVQNCTMMGEQAQHRISPLKEDITVCEQRKELPFPDTVLSRVAAACVRGAYGTNTKEEKGLV